MKPSPDRLELSNYPHTTEITTRFADIDPMLHLNNGAIVRLYEEARVAFFRVTLAPIRERHPLRSVLANVNIAYLREGRYPGTVTVGSGVRRIGGSSFTLGQCLFQDGVCIGTAETTSVHTRDGASAPLPDDARDALAKFMLRTSTEAAAG